MLEKSFSPRLEHCFGSPYPRRVVLKYTTADRAAAEVPIDSDDLPTALANAQATIDRLEADGKVWRPIAKRYRMPVAKVSATYANPPEIAMRMAEDNRLMANAVAMRFFGKGDRYKHMARIGTSDDFCAQAFIYLIEAARTFQPQLGYQFSTHAYKAIRLKLETWVSIEVKNCALGIPNYSTGVYNDCTKVPDSVTGFVSLDAIDDHAHPAAPDNTTDADKREYAERVIGRAATIAKRVDGVKGAVIRAVICKRTTDIKAVMAHCKINPTRTKREYTRRAIKAGLAMIRTAFICEGIKWQS